MKNNYHKLSDSPTNFKRFNSVRSSLKFIKKEIRTSALKHSKIDDDVIRMKSLKSQIPVNIPPKAAAILQIDTLKNRGNENQTKLSNSVQIEKLIDYNNQLRKPPHQHQQLQQHTTTFVKTATIRKKSVWANNVTSKK